MTIDEFNTKFPDEESCLEYLWQGKNITCCGSFHRVRKAYQCSKCKKQYSICTNTIFEKSSTPLTKWFYAIWLFAHSKHGVSAAELQRQLGVTYKTAWRMANKIRGLMTQSGDLLSGTVEVDETYIGRRMRLHNKNQQKPIVGIVSRGGEARAQVMNRATLLPVVKFINSCVTQGTKVMTDEARIYNTLVYEGYTHHKVKHSDWEWTRGSVHTNSVEGLWSHLKSALRTTHRSVSYRHLQSYVDERLWHWNHRHSPDRFQDLLGRLHD